MQNVQVTYDTSTNNARSESSVAINPNNQNQIVAASKKFADIETYNFTLATEYSTDAGQTWQASPELALPEGATVRPIPPCCRAQRTTFRGPAITATRPPRHIGIVSTSRSTGQSWRAQPHPQQRGRRQAVGSRRHQPVEPVPRQRLRGVGQRRHRLRPDN